MVEKHRWVEWMKSAANDMERSRTFSFGCIALVQPFDCLIQSQLWPYFIGQCKSTWLVGINRPQIVAPPQPSHTQLLYRLHCLTKPIAMDSPSNFEITSEHSESEHSEIQVTPVATPVKESTGKNKRRSVGAGTLSLLKKKHVWSFLKTRPAVKVHIYCVYAYL